MHRRPIRCSDPDIPPLTTPAPFLRDAHATFAWAFLLYCLLTSRQRRTMDDELVIATTRYLTDVTTRETAFGLWIAATGAIFGGYLIDPQLFGL